MDTTSGNVSGIDTGYVVCGGGMHTIAVEQEGDHIAYVQSSRIHWYDPRIHEAHALAHLRMLERAHMRTLSTQLEKWCAACGDMRSRSYFSPEPRNHDGLRAHCKQCRNEQDRKLYRLEREAAGQSVREYKRREAAVIEVDFTPAVTPLKRTA